MSLSLGERLGRWQAGLGSSGGALWRGLLRGGWTLFLTSLFAVCLATFENATFNRDSWSGLAAAGWGAYLALVVGALGAIGQRWGEQAPWRTAFACTLLAQLAFLFAVAQWGYLQESSLNQVSGWQHALSSLAGVRLEFWLLTLGTAQLFGASVLFRHGKRQASFWYANVAFMLAVPLILLGIVYFLENWIWDAIERRAPAQDPPNAIE